MLGEVLLRAQAAVVVLYCGKREVRVQFEFLPCVPRQACATLDILPLLPASASAALSPHLRARAGTLHPCQSPCLPPSPHGAMAPKPLVPHPRTPVYLPTTLPSPLPPLMEQHLPLPPHLRTRAGSGTSSTPR